MFIKTRISRLFTVVLALVMLLSTAAVYPVSAATEEEDAASRLINVVYDDSTSMIYNSSRQPLTAWSEAKYSLMILNAMMQDNDIMNVYYMSDFADYDEKTFISIEHDDGAPHEGLANLSGQSDKKAANVKAILNAVDETHGTYFNSIVTAYNDLIEQGGSYDERHLVVLTDGKDFTGDPTIDNVNELFKTAAEHDITVSFLAIGAEAMKPTESEHVQVFHATGTDPQSDDSILNRVKELTKRVFQQYESSMSSSTLTLPTPVSEIVVFAQGADVSIGNIKDTTKFEVSAALSEKDRDKASSSSYVDKDKDVIVAEGLGGIVAVFKPKNGKYIPEGSYTLDIKAANYSVYYKPCLDVSLKLTDKDGAPVEEGTEIPLGQYTVDYFLTYPDGHAKHGQPLGDLGFDVEYTLNVACDGVLKTPIKGNGPQKVTFGEGSTLISVTAKYLTYISTDTSVSVTVADFEVYPLKLAIEPDKRSYTLSEMESTKEGYTVTVKHEDGSALSADEWRMCELSLSSEGVDFFDPVKNDDQSFTVRPKRKNGSYEGTGSGEVPFTAVISIKEGKRVTFKGSVNAIADIYNDVIPVDALGGFKVEILNITPDKITTNDFNGAAPAVNVKITWNGNPLTKAQHEALNLSAAFKKEVLVKDASGKDVPLLIVKDITINPYEEGADTTATIRFSAQGDSDTQRKKIRGKDDFVITATIEREGFTHTATAEGDLDAVRKLTLGEILFLLTLLAIILFILFAYVIFKKYLPTSFYFKNNRNSVKPVRPYTSFATWLSVLVPFMNVTNSFPIHFTVGSDGETRQESARLRIQAHGKKKVVLTNALDLYRSSKVYVQGKQSQMERLVNPPASSSKTATKNKRNQKVKPVLLNLLSTGMYCGSSNIGTFTRRTKKKK